MKLKKKNRKSEQKITQKLIKSLRDNFMMEINTKYEENQWYWIWRTLQLRTK